MMFGAVIARAVAIGAGSLARQIRSGVFSPSAICHVAVLEQIDSKQVCVVAHPQEVEEAVIVEGIAF
jgi:hypothetical protein